VAHRAGIGTGTWLAVAVAAIASAGGSATAAATSRADSIASAAAGAHVDTRTAAPAGSGSADLAFYAARFETVPSVTAMTSLGREMFRDPALSASGRIACASCHSPAHAFGPPNGRAVQRGGIDGRQPGVRAVPSLRYLQTVPPFTQHFVEDEGDGADQGPAGGRTWDGRAQSAHDQARLPLFSPFEMANSTPAAIVAAVRRSAYAPQFRATFGTHIFDDTALAFTGVLLALETYQQDPAEFYPYSSKYDAWLRHEATLTDEEARGLAAFNDPGRGNCARCHPSAARAGAFPQFSDFGYAALGAPRNAQIPANADPRYHDLGLCGPLRTDLADRPDYCGMFRTPSLRNVATRRVFFHNGVVHRLSDAVRFYAERDTRPQRWYPFVAAAAAAANPAARDRTPRGVLGQGATRTYDDLPAAFQRNLERSAPFDRRSGDPPALSETDIRAIVAFLATLTDGYR
jgi:cytochrome c peroxidase